MDQKCNNECQGTVEAINAEIETLDRAMLWNGVEVTHGGDLVFVHTAWAVGVSDG